MPDRRELERRVDELAGRYSGQTFADAVRRLSDSLRENEREELKAILLARAQLLENAVEDRFRARGWLTRTFSRLEEIARADRSPPRNRRHR